MNVGGNGAVQTAASLVGWVCQYSCLKMTVENAKAILGRDEAGVNALTRGEMGASVYDGRLLNSRRGDRKWYG
jgi:hypothetical protein